MKTTVYKTCVTTISIFVLVSSQVQSQVIFEDDEPSQPPQNSNFNQNRPQFQQQNQNFPQSPQPPNQFQQQTQNFPQSPPPNQFQQQQQFSQPAPTFRRPDCRTFRNTDGFCVGINKCDILSAILNSDPRGRANRILRRSICGFSGFLPMVCCPSQRTNFNNGNGIDEGENGPAPAPPPPPFTSSTPFTSSAPFTTTSSPFQVITGNGNPNSQNLPTQTTPQSPPFIPATQAPQAATQFPSSTKSPFEIGSPVTLLPPKQNPHSTSSLVTGSGDPGKIPIIPTPVNGFSAEGLPNDCGFSNASHKRIVGGSPAQIGAWPWIAAIGYKDSSGNIDYLCGGALIAKQYVVTASHCVRDDLFTVRLGDHDLFSDSDKLTPINIEVAEKMKHPRYNSTSFQNDIALLRLSKPVDFTAQVHPICLPTTAQLRSSKFEDTNPYVAGWGAIQFNGPTSQSLREVQVPVIQDSVCHDKYKTFKSINIDSTNLCAGFADGGKDACQGDSGGPLMMPVDQFKYVLIGVVSFGFRCAEPGFPGVYSRVTAQLDWIQSVINHK